MGAIFILGFFIFQIIFAILLHDLNVKRRLNNKVVKVSLMIVNRYFLIAMPLTLIQYMLLEISTGERNFIIFFSILILLIYLIILGGWLIEIFDSGYEKNIAISILFILFIGTVIFTALDHINTINFITKEVIKEEKLELLYFNELPVLEETSLNDLIVASVMEEKIEDESQANEITYWYFDENKKAKRGVIEKEKVTLDFLTEDDADLPYLEIVTKIEEETRIEISTGKRVVVGRKTKSEEYCFFLPEIFKSYAFSE